MVVMAVDLSILNIYKSKLACFLLEQSTHPKLGWVCWWEKGTGISEEFVVQLLY